jgi:hypothetical protein
MSNSQDDLEFLRAVESVEHFQVSKGDLTPPIIEEDKLSYEEFSVGITERAKFEPVHSEVVLPAGMPSQRSTTSSLDEDDEDNVIKPVRNNKRCRVWLDSADELCKVFWDPASVLFDASMVQEPPLKRNKCQPEKYVAECSYLQDDFSDGEDEGDCKSEQNSEDQDTFEDSFIEDGSSGEDSFTDEDSLSDQDTTDEEEDTRISDSDDDDDGDEPKQTFTRMGRFCGGFFY